MAARAAVVSLIATDPQMNMLGIDEEVVFGSNATDTPRRDRMFVVNKWDEVTSSGGLPVYVATIWFHVPRDMERDYGKIDVAILRMKEIMRSAEQVAGADGWVLAAATWVADSPDFPDDGYNSLTRYTQFRCACRNEG